MHKLTAMAAVLGVALAWTAVAQVPSDAPAGTTGQCRDGSYTAGASKQGACRGHKGVKAWYGAVAGGATAPASAAPAASAGGAVASTSAPPGVTGQCNDGTYATSATKKGACRGHKGVRDWYATAAAAGASVSAVATGQAGLPAAPATATAAAPAPATPAAPAVTPPPRAAPAAVAAGGGAGQVWVNTKSKVYHCQGDSWYGRTKDGTYMSEAAAQAAGNRAARGKTCQ